VKDPKDFARYKRQIRRKFVSISNQEKCHVPCNIVSSGKACVRSCSADMLDYFME